VTAAPLQVALRGAGGEPVDLWRTLVSHGFAGLPPHRLDEEARTFETTLALDGFRPRTVRLRRGKQGFGVVEPLGRAPGKREREAIAAAVTHILRLDEDLSAFYALIAADEELSWAAAGAGRMLRSPTVFEDVVKTICTTNCA